MDTDNQKPSQEESDHDVIGSSEMERPVAVSDDSEPHETSSSVGARDDEEIVSLFGYIDEYAGGEMIGWAYDSKHPSDALDVLVYDGDELVGSGSADIYRQDLKDAGIGSGRHGFRLRIRKPLHDGRAHELALFDKKTAKPIEGGVLSVDLRAVCHAKIHTVEAGNLCADIDCTNIKPEVIRVAVFVDEVKVGVTDAKPHDDGFYKVRFSIPGIHFDGMPHVLSIAALDYPGGEAFYIDVLRPIATPWQHIATDASTEAALYAGLPANISRRLSALHMRMEDLAAQGEGEQLGNILTSLSVLNEGFEGRKEYPKLKLPVCADPVVSIIIPVHNKFALTYHCIASLILSNNQCAYEVIIVDDCSTDKTTDITHVVENLRVVVNEENLGFLRSCNKAAQLAKGQFIVLLNNDTEVGVSWLDEMLAVFERFDRVGAVGAKLIFPDGKLQEAGGIVWGNGQPWNLGRYGNPYDPEWNYVRQVDYLSGAALMVPKQVWSEVGGLSDEFAPAYYEDTDLAFKVRAAGYRTLYCPHSEVIHFEGMSHGRDTAVGFKKYQAINAPKFCNKWVDAYANNGRVGEDVWRNKDRGLRFRALVIDYATPQPDKDAGSYAAVQEMRLLQAHGFKLTFIPENLAHFGGYTTNLQKMGIECIHGPFYPSIADFLEKRGHEFDLVFITRFSVAERHIDHIRSFTKAKVLFNNADLHFLRELRALLSKKEKDLSGPLATRERELSVMRKVDAVLTYNDAEKAVITSHNLVDDNIFKCPWVLPARGHQTPFEERSGIAFLGGYNHHPNVEAVEYFVEQVMPVLRARDHDIKFYVYGSSMPEKFSKYEADDVVLVGYVKSLDEIFERCRLFVAPLLSGAGIKGKVLEAMSYGVPTVLTPIAAESTGLTNGISASIVETPEEWADEIVRLYHDKAAWSAISANVVTLAENNYSFNGGWKQLGKALAYLGFYSGKLGVYPVSK